MRDLAAWTALTLETPNPVPYAAEIVASSGGERWMRAPNTVGQEHDPRAYAGMRTIRLGAANSAFIRSGAALFRRRANLAPCAWPVPCGLVWTVW